MEKVNTEGAEYAADNAASDLVTVLEADEQDLGLSDALLYYDFPIYRDDAGEFVTAKILIVSPRHGFVVIASTKATRNNAADELRIADSQLDNAFSSLYSRLLRNKALRATKTTISVPDRSLIYAPFLDKVPDGLDLGAEVVTTHAELLAALKPGKQQLTDEVLSELLSTIEGAKGLIRPKVRNIAGTPAKSKGRTVAEIESAIASFDLKQKTAYVSSPTGVDRIRGLAGSGKTVILAMKAALTHLRYPEARIAYTFSTRSLYQHIQRLITRFYRQFHEQDPDWDRLKILHAWGGKTTPGVYSVACEAHGIPALTFRDARVRNTKDAFDFVCTQLLKDVTIRPIYDYIFLDEGQDFPASFVKLCAALSQNNRVAWAYDDLQTIFQARTPTAAEIFGTLANGQPKVNFERDVVLYRCYRNPRELFGVRSCTWVRYIWNSNCSNARERATLGRSWL